MEKTFKTNNEIEEENKEILLELALQINKELLIENKISYKEYKTVEESILIKLKNKR